jgi:hypothetical protein
MSHVDQVLLAGAAWVEWARPSGVDREYAFVIYRAMAAFGNIVLAALEDRSDQRVSDE